MTTLLALFNLVLAIVIAIVVIGAAVYILRRTGTAALNDLMKHPELAKKVRSTETIPPGEGVIDLVREGKTDEAIEVYRQFAGVDVFTAQEVIEDVQRELRLSDGVDENQLAELLAEGRKIEAIQYYRDQTGADLEDAKATIEAMQRRG